MDGSLVRARAVGFVTPARGGSADDPDGCRDTDERRGLPLAEVVTIDLEVDRAVGEDPELLEVLEDDRGPAPDAAAAEHPAGGPQRPDGTQLAHRDQVEAPVERCSPGQNDGPAAEVGPRRR